MKRRRQPVPKWQGELAKPIKWTGPTTDGRSPLQRFLKLELAQEEKEAHQQAVDKANQEVLVKKIRKIALLTERYKIELKSEGALLFILLQLAEETVPGFQIDYGNIRLGRRQKWTSQRYTELVADVEVEKRRPRRGGTVWGDVEACRSLVKSKLYRDRYGQGRGSIEARAKALNSRLVEARNSQSVAVRIALIPSPIDQNR